MALLCLAGSMLFRSYKISEISLCKFYKQICINGKECEKTSKFSKELKLFQSKIVRDKDVTQISTKQAVFALLRAVSHLKAYFTAFIIAWLLLLLSPR
ncbi:hypothetical protein ACRAOJ_07755 [Campylobacter majalis]